MTPEYIKQQAEEAQAKFRSIAVASGIVTQEEADKYLRVLPGDPADPKFHNVEGCSSCGCGGHEMIPLMIGIGDEIGEERIEKLVALLEEAGGAEN